MVKLKLKDLLSESIIPATYTDIEQLCNQFGKNKGEIGKLLEFRNDHIGMSVQYEVCINIKAVSGDDKLEIDIT